MALDKAQYKDREFLAVIGDEVVLRLTAHIASFLTFGTQDSVTGILLAGVGVRSPLLGLSTTHSV